MSAGLSVQGVTQTYLSADGQQVDALDTIDLDIAPGEFVTLAGPSGCGKTTLLRILAGFVTPTSGEVVAGGTPVTGPGPDRGVVFQKPTLFPWMSVRDNVGLGPTLQSVPAAQRRERVDRFLELVSLTEFADRRPYELSGGMQQRCQLARVLAAEPEVVLMDEPFGALDALTRERMQDELRTIWRERRPTVFFITHDIDEATLLGSRLLVMSSRPGRIVLDEQSPFVSREADSSSPLLPGSDLRELPEYAQIRHRLSEAIYAQS